MARELYGKEVLLFLLGDAWEQLDYAIKGMTSEEFYWKPVPKALGLQAVFEENRQGVSTIGFKIAHVIYTILECNSYLNGKEPLSLKEMSQMAPKDFPGWMELLKESWGSLATKAQEMSEEEILSLKRAWDGEYPSWKIIVWTADHSFWHAGQLRTMRALYQAKEGRGVL